MNKQYELISDEMAQELRELVQEKLAKLGTEAYVVRVCATLLATIEQLRFIEGAQDERTMKDRVHEAIEKGAYGEAQYLISKLKGIRAIPTLMARLQKSEETLRRIDA